jgi:hypothetical protein
VPPGEGDASYRLTRLHSRLDGLPRRSVAAACERRPSGRDLGRALTDTQPASGKALVVMCSGEVPRLDAVSVRNSPPRGATATIPAAGTTYLRGGTAPVLEGLAVTSGKISSPQQVTCRLAACHDSSDDGG